MYVLRVLQANCLFKSTWNVRTRRNEHFQPYHSYFQLCFEVRTYVCKNRWTPTIAEELCCQWETGKIQDPHAVAFLLTPDGMVVGHVPRKMNNFCSIYKGDLVKCNRREYPCITFLHLLFNSWNIPWMKRRYSLNVSSVPTVSSSFLSG